MTTANIATLQVPTLNSSLANITTSLVSPLANLTTANIATLQVPTLNSSLANITTSLVSPLANLTVANIATLQVPSLNISGTVNVASFEASTSNIGTINVSNLVTSNITSNVGTFTNIVSTGISSTSFVSGDFSYRPTFQQGIVTSGTSNISTMNVLGGSYVFGATGTFGVDTTFTSSVYGIPLHMIIACSGESSNVAVDGSFVATINAPTKMLITGTRAFLGTRTPDAANNHTLYVNIGITSSPAVSPSSIYSSQMTIGPGQYTSWSGSGSSNGTILNGSVDQGSFIRISASCTNNGAPLPPQGLKVILYYKVVA